MILRSNRWRLGAAACAVAVTAAVAVSAQRGAPESRMTDAAKEFLAKLEPAQREKAKFAFGDDERLNWHFIPKPRKGLPLKEMNAAQQQAALNLLQASLSDEGTKKTTTIRQLEGVLREIEKGSGPVRDPELYFFSVFGEPADDATWGWRYEGHHCSINWTVVKGKAVATSPQFMGTNPAEVMEGPMKGTRALAAEEDVARKLVTSLTDEQKKEAIISATPPADILTGAQRQAAIQENKGIAYTALTDEQKQTLRQLIGVYARSMPEQLARQRMAALRQAGPNGIKFAWMGPVEKGQKQYYRVQGSTFLIEFDNTTGNHIHAVWRDFKGDFGMDLLAMHYQRSPHKVAASK